MSCNGKSANPCYSIKYHHESLSWYIIHVFLKASAAHVEQYNSLLRHGSTEGHDNDYSGKMNEQH